MNKKLVPANEYKNVTRVIEKYVEAFRVGSPDMLADIFLKDAVTYGTVDGKLMGGSNNPSVQFIKDHGKSPEIEAQIDVLDITQTTAVVRVVMEKDAIGSDCIEYLTLIKINEAWIIIGKAFHQFDT